MRNLNDWIGKTQTYTDQVTAAPVAALSATLDRDDPYPKAGDALPPLWHWLYFLPIHRQSEIGADGHAARGGFLPPVPLPRRMWAGSRFQFQRPLRIGESISETSRIVNVTQKEGRAGALVFVVVRHEISNAQGIALTEEHDIVYRENAKPGDPPAKPQPAPEGEAWSRKIVPDEVLLFRYSSLTFNGHRIHYDRRYVTEVEGYPGLIVHGPLIATLLVDLLRRNMPNATVAGFTFRAVKPLFDIAPFMVCGKPQDDGSVKLWTRDAQGAVTMDATATFA